MSLEHTPCPHNMQTSKFNDDIIPFQVTFRGLQLVSQLYLPPKWPWTAEISSGNCDEVVITIPLQYHCMISSLSFPILGQQRLGRPNLPALELKSQVGFNPFSRWDSNPLRDSNPFFVMGFDPSVLVGSARAQARASDYDCSAQPAAWAYPVVPFDIQHWTWWTFVSQ